MQCGAHPPVPVEELAPPKAMTRRIAPREVEERREVSFQPAQPSLRSGVAAVWRDALSTFSAQSLPILMFALAGFWGVTLIGALVRATLQLDFDGHTSDLKDSAGSAHRMMMLLAAHERKLQVVVLIQVLAGMLALSFARGVITWLALHGSQPGDESERSGSIGQAMRVTLQRYPTLLIASLLYGAIITAGIVATSGLAQAMEFAPSQAKPAWSGPSRAFRDGLRQLVWRGFNTLLPDPGSPFAEFMPDQRRGVVKQSVQLTPYEQFLAEHFGIEAAVGTKLRKLHTLGPQPNHMHGIWMMALAGMLLILLAETLLRFRIVMALQPPRSPRPRRLEWLMPLFASARFGVRHFGEITLHIWLVRLAIFALCLGLIEFPSAVMDHVVVPNVIVPAGALRVGEFEVLPIMKFMADASAGLVGAILLAFSVVYDAKLYLALSAKTNPQTNLWQVTETSQAHGQVGQREIQRFGCDTPYL